MTTDICELKGFSELNIICEFLKSIQNLFAYTNVKLFIVFIAFIQLIKILNEISLNYGNQNKRVNPINTNQPK